MKKPVVLFAALLLLSCSDDGDGGPPLVGRRAEVLANLGQNVILPAYREAATRTETLASAVQAYADAPSTASRDAARAAWADAIAAWQHAELMQLGPAAAMDAAAGGEDLRDDIYPYPALNLCVIDQLTVRDGFDDPDVVAAESPDRRGLGAIEYLLFNESPDNTCSPLSTINADGTWALYTPEEIEARRARLAHSFAVIADRRADALVARWDEGFLLELTDPTRSGALYGSAQEGLNAVSDAMFYLDTDVKDMKVGEPAGIVDCLAATCPEVLESRFARVSKAHVVANLEAFRALFLGGEPSADGLGFDDLLDDVGATDLKVQMTAAIDAALAAAGAIEESLVDALTADLPSVVALHAAIKAITDMMKSTFLSVLDLEAPDRAAGDND